ncbi:MAG: four helix bundle protein [Candidatus Marinimicrobia bacterium]|nr:four helix bundle protein [Candidatus Neomarinimicrobiota bacterium]
MSVAVAMRIFEILRNFPKEEKYSLTDQIRRSSRSVSSNITEVWRRRRYEGAFIDKLNISESEAAETQVWLEYAVKCKYLDREIGIELNKIYDNIIGKLVNMANDTKLWLLKAKMSPDRYREDTDV